EGACHMGTSYLLSRRTVLRAALIAGSLATEALLAACGESGATVTPLPGQTGAGGTGTANATVAAPTSVPTPMTASTTGTGSVAAPATVVSNRKTIAELRVAVQAIPPTLDPQAYGGNIGSRINPMAFDTLIRRDVLKGDQLVLSLATDWKRIDDRTLEVNLR